MTSSYVPAFREIGNWRECTCILVQCLKRLRASSFRICCRCLARLEASRVPAQRLRDVVSSSEIGNESGIRNTSKDTPTADQRGRRCSGPFWARMTADTRRYRYRIQKSPKIIFSKSLRWLSGCSLLQITG